MNKRTSENSRNLEGLSQAWSGALKAASYTTLICSSLGIGKESEVAEFLVKILSIAFILIVSSSIVLYGATQSNSILLLLV